MSSPIVQRNVLFLDVELRRIRKMLEESWPQRVERQAQATSKAAEQTKYREAYNARHTPESPDAA